MALFYKIAQLVINPERSGSVSRAHISQPDTTDEEKLGRLLILSEFPAKKPDYQALFNLIVDQISIAYYENEQIILLDKLATVTVQSIFESALSKLNLSLYDIWQGQSLKFNPEEFNLTICVIHENKLFFANLGRNKALLIYKPKTPNLKAEQQFNLINITKKTNDPREDILIPNKIMSNVVSGMIPTNGYFLFTNEALFEYLSEKQLIKIITTLAPAGAAKQIDNLFQQTQLAVPFSIFIIKNQKGQEPSDYNEPTVVSYGSPELHTITTHRTKMPFSPEKDINKESIRALNKTEALTASILKPSGILNYDRLKTWYKTISKLLTPRKKNILKVLPAKVFDRKNSLAFFNKFTVKSFQLLLAIWYLIKHSLSYLTHKDKRQSLTNKLKNFRQRITKRHLVMIAIVLAVLAALSTSIYTSSIKVRQAKEIESFKQLSLEIGKYETQIASDLSYGNRDKARESINKISELLNNFPQTTQVANDEFQAIKSRHQSNLELINDVTRIDDLEQIGNFTNTGKLGNIASIDQYLYLTNDDTIIQFDKQTKINPIKIPTESTSLQLGLSDTNGTYWLIAGNQIIQSTVGTENIKRLALDNNGDIKGMEVYFNKLYIYNSTDKQIYRYQLTANGLKDKTAWILNNEGIEDVRSLAIDSNIYLLDRNTVHKYTSGRKQNFSLSPVEPALSNPSKIITLREGNLIYVLEPDQKRFVVYNKDGKFLSQYTSILFDNLIDFTIDEKYQMMYFLSGTNIYQTKLPIPINN